MKVGSQSQQLSHSCSVFYISSSSSQFFFFSFFCQIYWKKGNKPSLCLKKHHCTFLVSHLMNFKSNSTLVSPGFLLIFKLFQRIEMIRMFLFSFSERRIYLVMFCSDAWLLNLYPSPQSTKSLYNTDI